MTQQPKKQWRDLNRLERTAIIAGGAVELVLTGAALRDLVRSDRVRGPKPLWALSFVVQPFGPVAYLLLGRRDRS